MALAQQADRRAMYHAETTTAVEAGNARHCRPRVPWSCKQSSIAPSSWSHQQPAASTYLLLNTRNTTTVRGVRGVVANGRPQVVSHPLVSPPASQHNSIEQSKPTAARCAAAARAEPARTAAHTAGPAGLSNGGTAVVPCRCLRSGCLGAHHRGRQLHRNRLHLRPRRHRGVQTTPAC